MNFDPALLVMLSQEVDDTHWKKYLDGIRKECEERAKTFPQGAVATTITERNIGRGADWIVIAVALVGSASYAAFAIPKAHKQVRESLEEWKRIFRELKAIYSWIRGARAALFPDTYLFLVALDRLSAAPEAANLVFQSTMRLPEDDPNMKERESLLLSFTYNLTLEQIAASRRGEVLWTNRIELNVNPSLDSIGSS